MDNQQIYDGAIKIAGSLALEIPDNEAVINRSLALATGIFGKLNPKMPEQPARAEDVEKTVAPAREIVTPEPEVTTQGNYLDEVFLS